MKKFIIIIYCLVCWQLNKAQNVGIGTANPATSAQLEVSSNTKGFLMPRMTTTQRDSIVSPVVGLQIFNLDDHCTDLYDGTNWIKNCGLKVIGPTTDPLHPTSNSWVQKANFGGGIRQNAVGFSIGSKGYIGTGFDGSNKKDFWEYDPASNAWSQKADFGGGLRFRAVGFSISNRGYIGTGSDAGIFNNDFWEYDPLTNIWTQKANFGGQGRYGAVSFSISGKGYIGTGYDGGGPLSDFWEYDPASNTWAQKANAGGGARDGAVGFSIGNKGYIGTGFDGGVNTNDFWEFDPQTNTWLQKGNFGGAARFSAVGFSIGSKGYIGTGGASGVLKDFWEYNPITNGWIQKADFSGSAVYGATGFSIGNRGFIGTGNNNNSGPIADFREYLGSNLTGVTYSSLSVVSTDNIITDGAWSLYNGTVFNANTGNVGIGTNTPANKLDVAGGIKASTTLTIGSFTTAGIVTNNSTGLLVTTPIIPVVNGGTGANSLTGYIKGNGTEAMTALSTLPATDLTGIVPVVNGGTGANSLTGYIKGNGTGAMIALPTLPATDLTGIVPVVNGGTGANSLTGYIKGNGTGAMTAQTGLPATDLTGMVPVANGGTGTGTAFTAGSLVFAGAAGLYSQNNAQLFWNNTNQRLGIGTPAPTNKLSVSGTGGILSSTTNNGSGTADWIAGNFGATTGNRVVIGLLNGQATIGGHNNALAAWANLLINPDGGNVGIGTNNPTNKLTVSGNVNILGLGGTGNRRVYADANGTLNVADDAGCVVRTQNWTANAIGKLYTAGTYEAPSAIVTDGTYGDTRLATSGDYNRVTGNSLSTGVFTAPTEGYYMVSLQLFDLVASSRLWLVASHNGNVPSDFIDQPVLNQCASCFDFTFSKIIYLFAGDNHRILRHTSGVAINNMIVSYRKL